MYTNSGPLQQDADAVRIECAIVGLLRVAASSVPDVVTKQRAVKSLEQHRGDSRVQQFFIEYAEQARRAQLRQRALNLKNRPIK